MYALAAFDSAVHCGSSFLDDIWSSHRVDTVCQWDSMSSKKRLKDVSQPAEERNSRRLRRRYLDYVFHDSAVPRTTFERTVAANEETRGDTSWNQEEGSYETPNNRHDTVSIKQCTAC